MGSGNTVLDSVARTTFPEGWQWSNSRDAPLTHLVWGQTPRKEAFSCPDTLILKDAQVALTLDTGRTHPGKQPSSHPESSYSAVFWRKYQRRLRKYLGLEKNCLVASHDIFLALPKVKDWLQLLKSLVLATCLHQYLFSVLAMMIFII